MIKATTSSVSTVCCLTLAFVLTTSNSEAFQFLLPRCSLNPSSKSKSIIGLYATSNTIDDEGKEQSTPSTDEAAAQKEDLLTTLSELENLQENVLEASDKETLESLKTSLNDVETNVATQMSMLLPPMGMSSADYAATMRTYAKLPVRSRIAFCKALELDNPVEAALDFARIPEIATLLYTERSRLTPAKLQSAMKATESLIFQKQNAVTVEMPPKTSEKAGVFSLFQQNTSSSSTTTSVGQALSAQDEQFENLVSQTFSRVTRKEGREATQRDLEVLKGALNRETFLVSSTKNIPGGFLVFGTPNERLEPPALLKAIDKKLPRQWPCQVMYIKDFTAQARGDDRGLNAPMLVLLRKDMSPEPRLALRTLSNLVAMSTAFLFSIGVYGGNKVVMDRLEENSATGDFVGFEWFTEKTLEVLLPILAIQLIHELGHLLVQKRYDLKTSFPTLLPGWGLPFLGCQSNLVESAPSKKALFDFAFVGPLLGLLAALGFFVTGLEFTNAAGPETIKYLPAVPVDVLRSSTLGGSLVDYFLGGGQGFITLQDPKETVPLHPYAIAGFVGILTNALALIPLGSTDGGRLSITIFGRPGQLLIGAGVWFFLLIASFSFERADALIGAWVTYNIVQNDLEIPCRDEVTEVDAIRAVSAFALWFVAILAIVPM